MSEESVSYEKPKYKIGDTISFLWYGQGMTGTITSVLTTERGYAYAIKTKEGGNYESDEACIKPLYGVSYVADKPKASLGGQVGGEHYKNLAIQPVVYCYYNNIPGIESSIIRYATRHRDKNKAQDVEKIIHYAKILLQLEYNYTDEQINEL